MKTTPLTAVAIVLGLGTFSAAGCSPVAEDTEHARSTSAALTVDEELEAVRAACHGVYRNHGQCQACVAHQHTSLTSEFAHGECQDLCIKTSCAIEGKTCGTVPDGCGGALPCGPSCGGPLLTAAENHAAYELHAVCTLRPATRIGTAPNCCRDGASVIDTTCTTTLHEEVDSVTGKLVLRIDPMSSCATTTTPSSCNRSGDLTRCDSAGITCPFPSSTLGAPSILEGTYRRTVVQDGANLTTREEYRGDCGSAVMVGITGTPSCATSPATVVNKNTWHVSTFTRTAPGAFSVRRAWTDVSVAPSFCADPITVPYMPLPYTGFVSGAPASGGSFSVTSYTCTYELALKP